jgi:hypothetical protein
MKGKKMTTLNSEVASRIKNLLPQVHDEISKQISECIKNKPRWNTAAPQSQKELEKLAKKPLKDSRIGRANKVSIDESGQDSLRRSLLSIFADCLIELSTQPERITMMDRGLYYSL